MLAKILHSPHAAALSVWLTLLTAFFAVLSWLTPEWWGQLSAPQAILAGLGMALSVSLFVAITLTIGAYGFRLIRPLPPSEAPSPEYDPATGSMFGSKEQIQQLQEEIRKQGISISGLCKVAEEAKTTSISLKAAYAEELSALEAKFKAFEDGYVAHRSLNADAAKAQFENVFLALEAIHDRHRLSMLEGQLNLNADSLLVQEDTPKFDDNSWGQWEANEDRWRTNVEAWCERASKYLHDVRDQVFATPERSYRTGDWPSDDLFGNSMRVHAYKTFVIIWKNLGNLRGEVARRVHLAAFERRALQMRGGDIA